MGKLIYNPQKAAKEYGVWAVNLVIGCYISCLYCYRNHGITAKAIGGSNLRLKSLKTGVIPTEDEIYQLFIRELTKNVKAIGDDYLFFSFTTDPMLPEYLNLTWKCIKFAVETGVKVCILTKLTQWVENPIAADVMKTYPGMLKIGFTLTGHDELEPNASPNMVRIQAMEFVKHNYGVTTWASLEPVMSIQGSIRMILACIEHNCCDEFKIGLVSGMKRPYSPTQVRSMMTYVQSLGITVYWKNSVFDYIK